ncbi:hypothetical protein [Pseudanabaena sp. BC1403]|uniref:hypothetical protein n=1 Tax=Pseudanabaena sp. BC1403 TaxID=2043171 RepID=UPI000CD897D7|nr:hypothetical protein [Pseudanabaena sp. BC1403]
MSNLVWVPSSTPVSVPENSSSVPLFGTQALTNHSEALAYFAQTYHDINASEKVLFSDDTTAINMSSVFITYAKGLAYMETRQFIRLNNNWAAYPNGGKLHKQTIERLPNQPHDVAWNA